MVRYQTVLKWWDRYQMQVGPEPKLIINFKFRKGIKVIGTNQFEIAAGFIGVGLVVSIGRCEAISCS